MARQHLRCGPFHVLYRGMVLGVELMVRGHFCDRPFLCYVGRSLIDSRSTLGFGWLNHGPWGSGSGAVMSRHWQAGCNGVTGVVWILAMVCPGGGGGSSSMVQRRLLFMTCV